MTSLLAIEVSPRADVSVSRKLTARFVADWRAAHPEGSVVIRDLVTTDLPYVDAPWIGGAFAPAEDHSPAVTAAIQVSDDLIAELQAADHVVIGTPMNNFSIPARLKAYIDHVVRVGVTVSADYRGLLTGKTATVLLVSGSDYAPGSPFESYNVASSYLRQILGFVGITDVTVVLAGSTTAVDRGERTLIDFVEQFAAPCEAVDA